ADVPAVRGDGSSQRPGRAQAAGGRGLRQDVGDGDSDAGQGGDVEGVAAGVGGDGGPGAVRPRAAVDEDRVEVEFDDPILRDAVAGVERPLDVAVVVECRVGDFDQQVNVRRLRLAGAVAPPPDHAHVRLGVRRVEYRRVLD